MEPKKTKQADLENKKSVFFMAGLLVALAFVLVAFEWRQYEDRNFDLGDLNIEIEDEIIPITQQETPPPPPPPPPAAPEILNIVENEEEIEEELEINTEANENTVVDIVFEEEEEEEEQIFVSVENMPTLPGCESMPNKMQKDQCTQQKIFQHLAKVQKYPPMMKEAGIQGTVFVTFVVDKDGKVTDVDILKGVSGGSALDEEAKRMISSLPKFNPGSQRGKPVKIRYNLPVKFSLK